MADARKTVLIFHDSLDFGGHEIMFFQFFPALLNSSEIEEIFFYFNGANEKLLDRLEAITSSKLRLKPWHFAKKRAEPYLGHLRLKYQAAVRAAYASIKPDVVLLIQGRIENTVVPMIALPSQARIVSYIPMAHTVAEMGKSGLIGDTARHGLYRRPEKFVVPSRAVAEQIAKVGGRAAMVADNVVIPPRLPSREEARQSLGMAINEKVALFLGRLDVAQKGLDKLVTAIKRCAVGLEDWTILFVGQGEGKALIDDLRATLSKGPKITHMPWTDRAIDYVSAADILLMPSRWEGVPLVMLEAIEAGTPLITSQIDVFLEYNEYCHTIDFAAADLAHEFSVGLNKRRIPASLHDARSRLKASSDIFLRALLD